MTRLAGLCQKHSGFCVSRCVENEGSWGDLGLEGSVALTSLPFGAWMVPAHLPWPGLATDFEFPLEYFWAWFPEAVSTYYRSNDRIRGHTAQSRSSTFGKLFAKSVGQNLR